MNCPAIVFLAAAFSSAAVADQSGNMTLTSNTSLNLDTGAISSVGGDVFWNGTALAAQGHYQAPFSDRHRSCRRREP